MTEFTFKKIPGTHAAMAQRYSIIVPLVEGPASGEHFLGRSGTRASLIRVLALWRERVKELRAMDWAAVDSSTNYLRCCNCPPPFSYTAETTQPCHRYLVCPMCWARQVVKETYERFEFAIYGSNRQTRLTPAGRTSVDRRTNFDLFELIDPVTYSQQRWTPEEVAASEQGELTRHRRHLVHADGVYYTTTIEPLQGDWLVRRRTLAILPITGKHVELPGGLNDRSTVKKHKMVNKAALAAAIGRVCQYPAGMLLDDADQAVEILHARGGPRGSTVRLSTYHGALRVNQEKRRKVMDLSQEERDIGTMDRRAGTRPEQ